MNSKTIVTTFFEAMKARDYATIASCYAVNAVFSDPIFPSLSGFEAGKMWEMLLRNAGDLDVDYKVIDAGKGKAKVAWSARYTFGKSGRRVHNNIVSSFEFMDGKIMTQRDRFHFRSWARQALGFFPWLLGFTGVTQKKVQETAERGLNDFIRLSN